MARHQALGVAWCVGGLEVRQGPLSHFKPLPSFGRTRGGHVYYTMRVPVGLPCSLRLYLFHFCPGNDMTAVPHKCPNVRPVSCGLP